MQTTAAPRPSFALVRDLIVRRASDRIFEAYRLDAQDRRLVAARFESRLFELVDLADQIAAVMAERSAIERRIKTHGETHPRCTGPLGCRAVGAMQSRSDVLDRLIGDGLKSLAKGTVG